MSEFLGSNKCYSLIVALENEHDALREMYAKYGVKSKENNREYIKTRNRAMTTIRCLKTRELKGPREEARKAIEAQNNRRMRTTTQPRKDRSISPLYEYPARPESRSWPVRKTSASRLLAPKKLEELKDYDGVLRAPKDLPIIHSTGIKGFGTQRFIESRPTSTPTSQRRSGKRSRIPDIY